MIDETRAIEIARARAEELGWAFAPPFSVTHRKGWRVGTGQFEIVTNAGSLGTKARFTIDAVTGRIQKEGYVPR